MNIEEYIYDLVLYGTLNDADRAYIESCISDIEGEGKRFFTLIWGLGDRAKALERKIEKENERYFASSRKIVEEVKKYNDSLSGDSIWASGTDENDKKIKLKSYYMYVSRLDGLVNAISFCDFYMSDIFALKDDLTQLGRFLYLYKTSLNFVGGKNEKSESLEAASKAAEMKIEELFHKASRLCKIGEENGRRLGDYLLSLSLALDVNNKGRMMNIRSAKNCNQSFVLCFITEV